MNERKKWKIIEYALALGFMIIICILAYVATLVENDTVLIVVAVILMVIMAVVAVIVERKNKVLKEEEFKEKQIENEKKLLKKLFTEKEFNNAIEAMYIILNKENEELNLLIKDALLNVSSDYAEEDNQFEVNISSDSKKKNFYYLALYCYENKYHICLNDEEADEIEIVSQSTDEIIEIIINDIKKYLN